MKTTLLALICILTSKVLPAQDFDSTDVRNVKWQPNGLTSDNFRLVDKKPTNPDSAMLEAVTGGWIAYRYWSIGPDHFRVWIQTYLDYNQSWMLRKSIKKKALLNHEQRHLDLVEIEARNFGKAIAGFAFTQNYQSEMPFIFKNVMDDLKRVQSIYDENTEHGSNSDAQKLWNAKIDNFLNTLPPVDGIFIDVEIHG
ncbi:MAG: DUF922 domain-containing protein [Chitinophagaceae bacterium]